MDCDEIRPLLFPYIEREIAPAEAMLVARHLSGCTACKILIARKRHLAHMLENGLEDRIPVGEDFVRSVMATLPDGPPPAAPPARRRRHLKLAGTIAVLVGLAPAVAARLPGGGDLPRNLYLPGFEAQGGGLYQSLLEIAQGTAGAAAGWLAGAPVDFSPALPSLASAAGLSALAFAALAASSGVLMLAASSILGSRRD